MKRNFVLLFLVFLALTIVPAFSEQPSGKLELIRGTVIYQLPGQTTWSALTQRSADLMVGTIIQTKENSQAILKFEDGCKLLIGEMTLFKIQSREEKEKKNLFTIKLFGKTFIEVKKEGAQNNFKIQTPTALATIRGSKMIVSVGDNLITKVTSVEGTIEVASTYLYKGTVLSVEDNIITLETAQGIKKISISPETIIPERNGSAQLKPNDRIAIYGLNPEEKTSSFFTGSELASLITLPPKNNTMAVTGGFSNAAAYQVLFTSASELKNNVFTEKQKILSISMGPIYTPTPTAPPVYLTGGLQTTVSTQPPTIPVKAPVGTPSNIYDASSKANAAQVSSTGEPKGAGGSTTVNEPADQSTTQQTTNTGTAGGTTPPPIMGAPQSLFPNGAVNLIVD